MHCFAEVVDSCLGSTRNENYVEKISDLGRTMEVLSTSITLKQHTVIKHVPEFLSTCNSSEGLAIFSEQATESSYHAFKNYWKGRHFHVKDLGSLVYKKNLFECFSIYNIDSFDRINVLLRFVFNAMFFSLISKKNTFNFCFVCYIQEFRLISRKK